MHKDRLSNYHPGTCRDFLDSDKVQSWISGTGTRIWCTGVPGAGKTIASSALVERLHVKFQPDKDVRIAAVFCNYKMNDTLSVANILAGVWLQVTTFVKLSDEAITLYDRNVEMGTRPSCEDYVKLLQLDLKSCSKVLIVVDALDELSDSSSLTLLKELDRLGGPINIMVTSRLSSSSLAPRSLKIAPTQETSASAQDMCHYIDARIDNDPLLANYVQVAPQLRDDIRDQVTKKAGKM